MKHIAWCITGAGHYLSECLDLVEDLLRRGLGVTLFISRAGEDVLRIYGLLSKLELLAQQYPSLEIVFESTESPSFPKAGKIYTSEYELVVVAPTTFNTLAKIASGICDTLVTNVVAHALKLRIPVVLLVPDLETPTEVEIPIYIDRSVCLECSERCRALSVCTVGAIYLDRLGLPHIDLKKCNLCGQCVAACPRGAIRTRQRVQIYPHPLLVQLVEKVKGMGILVLREPRELHNLILAKLSL